MLAQQQRQQLDQQHADVMASGLMPLPPGHRLLSKDVVPILQVYTPRPSTDKHRVQWVIPAEGPTRPAGVTASNNPTNNPNATAATSIGSGSSSSSTGSPQAVLSDPLSTTLCSKHSKHEAFVVFANPTPHTVRLLWVDYNGNEVSYDTLAPGQACIQQTFATHPWLAREVTTGTQLPINMQEAFCPANIPQNSSSNNGRQQVAAPHVQAPVAAEAPAGPPQDAAAAAPAGAAAAAAAAGAAGDNQQQHQQQQPEQWIRVDSPNGPQRVPASRLQRAEVCLLPRLAWSEASHTHFPATFKAAVRTFLLCHLQLQQQAPTCSTGRVLGATGAGIRPPTGLLAAVAAATAAAGGTSATVDESSACRLGSIPSLLLPQIVGFAAPFVPQHMGLPVEMRPDVKPTLLPEDPRVTAVAGGHGGMFDQADDDMVDADMNSDSEEGFQSDEGADVDLDVGVEADAAADEGAEYVLLAGDD